ncbi:MAG: electron transfer flavoprotein subunit beta/FixA family protein [Microcella sp.]|nr:electron transfer flavoprotein subunit beta/FixA family protein [Microcella sp.]
MRIVVLVKEVPDTWGSRELDLETGLLKRAAGEPVLDEVCERALEVALSYADVADCEVVALSLAPGSAEATVRKALALGAHEAVMVVDEALIGADLGLTAIALAEALKRSGFDLVVAGNRSTDGGGGVLPSMIAELLDVPHLTQLGALEISDGSVSGDRFSDDAIISVSAELPAVVSITDQLPEARFPDFKSTMAAKKKPLSKYSLADLDIALDHHVVPRAIMLDVSSRPPRDAGVTIVDEGDAGARLAQFLRLGGFVTKAES